ncbi:MAG TPA: glycosyltransferase [Actinomycetota bacterium]|nr:glycosyltransferase [Actinomycetota bacterium]
MNPQPLVSVVIPVFEEEGRVAAVISTIAKQTYPTTSIEVIVVDGVSGDETRSVATSAMSEHDFHSALVVENPGRTRPSNLNVALEASSGSIVCRVDARCDLPPEYISTCVEILSGRPEVFVVGGTQVAEVPGGAPLVARGIRRAMRNPVVMGWSRYRTSSRAGESDTVYLGAFRRDDLVAVGGWDERFLINEDFELNRRLAKQGLVWFDPRLSVSYVPRDSLTALFAQYRGFGRWKAAGWLEAGSMTSRHAALLLVPPAGVAGLAILGRSHPVAVGGAAVVLAAAIDLGAKDPAPVIERMAGLVAATAIVTGWYGGVVEQAIRWTKGERLIPQED